MIFEIIASYVWVSRMLETTQYTKRYAQSLIPWDSLFFYMLYNKSMDEQKLLPAPRRWERVFEWAKPWMTKKVAVSGAVLGAILLAVIWQGWRGGKFARPEFEEMYSLVPDKVSQSAAIPVRLPEGVRFAVAQAAEAIAFDPELKGDWHAGDEEDKLFFQPAKKLELGSYYAVTLTAGEITLSKDFLVDEDPRIVSVFPNKDSEASEYSQITIVFNRPMVPLTTLDELSDKEIPVQISPATPGAFKWITTRNLQFIPKDRLKRSSHYTVAIQPGFISMDGLSVPAVSYEFTTRPLRYEYMYPDSVAMQGNPVRIVFNQPIDIERTQRELTLKKGADAVDFAVGYGKRELYNAESKKYEVFLDKSILEIYNKHDQHGRENVWDFESQYSYTLAKAYPAEGDMILEQGFSGTVSIPPIIGNITAESPRSRHATQDLFDPEGKLWITFAEDINKDASKIEAPARKEIGYGEKCREPQAGEEVFYGEDCQKVPDQKRIYLTFDPSSFKPGQEFMVTFKKIVNADGLVMNANDIIKPVRIYPSLAIYSTVPGEGGENTDLTKMVVCSSNPLQIPDETAFYERVKSNVTVGLWNWHEPYRVTRDNTGAVCKVGQFENTILYGLVPEFSYKISLSLVDDFGQKAEKTVHFQSGKLSSFDRNFFHLQKEYNVTSPDRLKFIYGVDNIEYVNFHICEVTPETMLRYMEERPEIQTSPANLDCSNVFERRIDLPKTYWSRSYFQIKLDEYLPDPIGHYVLSFSHPEYRRMEWEWDDNLGRSVARPLERIYERTFVTVTKLAVQEKKVEWKDEFWASAPAEQKEVVSDTLRKAQRNVYWVTRFGSLDPVPDARVEIYKKGIQHTSSYATGNDGIALAGAEPDIVGAIVRSGKDSAIISERIDKLAWNAPAQAVEHAYVYTDKPIYRPGQQVFIKGIYRLGFNAEYRPMEGKKTEVSIRNSKYEEVSKKTLQLNEYGTFTTDFTLDANAPLGTYSITAPGGTSYFDVEEYVPAAFKVEAKGDREEYIAGDTMKLDVDANYYFGVPVEGGEVEYSLASQDFYFDRYQDGYFSFGRGWYYNFDGWYGDTFILRGKTVLDTHGKARISQQLDFNKFFKGAEAEKSKIFTAHITVRNQNGQSISTRKSFIVHRGELYAGVSLENNFVGKNEQVTARIKTVDTNGKEISRRNILIEAQKITWESFKRREVDGQYYYRSEEKRETVRKETVSTDRNGNAQYQFSLPDEGEYEVRVSAADDRGNPVSGSESLYVYGQGSVSVRPTNNETLDLATDKQDVSVGEKVKVIIKSPYERAKALVSIERGTIFSYHILDVRGGLAEFQFDVKEEYIPNVSVSILLLSSQPEIKYGEIQYRVNTKERDLNITARSDKNNYLPGETVNLDMAVKDKQGRPVQAELSLAVVDMSVLALKGNPKKNPVLFFFGGTPVSVSTASNIKNILHEADIPTGTKGGGGGSDELARKKRGVFKDTALWEGVVQTDGAGKAHVSFRLPDNLTTWQVESVGVTKDTKVGVGYLEFKARKELMVVPLKPRFIIPGDIFLIGGQVFNETDAKQKISLSFASQTLHLQDTDKQSVTLNAHESKTVYFSVEAPRGMREGEHVFMLSAHADSREDTVEDTIPITRNDTYESVATAHYTGDTINKEFLYVPSNAAPDRGGLVVKANATLAVYLSDALTYLVEYPFGCSEQIASKLSALAIVKRGLAVKNIGDAFTLGDVEFEGRKYSPDDVVRIGLARIYQNQLPEGGFTYYTGMRADPYLTMHIITALAELRDAGYAVDAERLTRAADYLSREVSLQPALSVSKRGALRSAANYFLPPPPVGAMSPAKQLDTDFVILAAYALSRVPGYENGGDIQKRISVIAQDSKYIREDSSNVSLAYLALILAKGYPEDIKDTVYKQLENRLIIDGRGASLSLQGRDRLYQFYETPIKDTALFIKALAADRRDVAVLDKALRWILASRSKDGSWGSTHNTAAVIDALTDFLNWKKESESAFNLSLALDSEQVGEITFDASNILQSFEKFLAMDTLKKGTIQTFTFAKRNINDAPNKYYYDMLLTYFLPVEKIPPRDEGFAITREFYQLDNEQNAKPVYEAKRGEVLRGRLTITVPEERNLMSVEDFIPAGMELVNLKLSTEDASLQVPEDDEYQEYPYGSREGRLETPRGKVAQFFSKIGFLPLSARILPFIGIKELGDEYYGKRFKPTLAFQPDAEELRDDRLFLFAERVPPGVYHYDYFVRALVPGTFHHLPAITNEMYFPENFGRSRGELFKITQ